MRPFESVKIVETRTKVRARILEEIERRRVTPEQLAERLDLLPVGAEVLLAQQDWALETAFRVAEVVGLRVNVSLENGD